MTADIFLAIDGISGESLDAQHLGMIEVTSWHWRIHQNAQMLAGAGFGAPKATVQDLVVVHQMDRASPNLMTFCLHGRRIPKAILTMRKAGGVPMDFFRITMEEVIVSTVEPSASAGGYYEQFSLSFSKIKQEYVLQNAAGGQAGM